VCGSPNEVAPDPTLDDYFDGEFSVSSLAQRLLNSPSNADCNSRIPTPSDPS